MSTPPLGCRDLAVDLGGRRVLRDVSLDIEPGAITVVLGPNGAGKTTLVRALLGLVPPARGSVHAPAVLGYVPQRSEMEWDYPVSAHDVVMLGLITEFRRWQWPRRIHYRRVADALERVRMSDLRDRPIGEMSGGQRQRVMIARALARDPRVLLLDEPFTGLDMPSQSLLSDLFLELAREGCALVMSTHDLTHALHIADRVLLLNESIIGDGAPGKLTDPGVWQRTFHVPATSPLLAHVGALVEAQC
ncbi:MAG: anchored repeat-type ABC transporter ATP-binding subunit [Dermabacter sp.]|nr:anchored repeat-type ABC transporter ATP-binding subunit [Dermabacter sp.]